MKTIQDLVDKLNASFDYADFSIKADYKQRKYYLLYMHTFDDYGPVIEFEKQSKDWSFKKTFALASNEVQKEIMDFIYTTNSNHWFDEPEKKYNIIIGRDSDNNHLTAYYKSTNDNCRGYTSSFASCCDLKKKVYIFSESEVEELKSTLPENMAKIVDLGKAEVNDED